MAVRTQLLTSFLLFVAAPVLRGAEALPVVLVEDQPLRAQTRRVIDALEFLGQPLSQPDRQAVGAAMEQADDASAALQKLLDGHCLALVHINPESRVKVAQGPARPVLVENGWTVFLVKVHNEAGVTAPLRVSSPNAAPIYRRSSGSPDPKPSIRPQDVAQRWLDVQTFDQKPLTPTLTGLAVEYRIVQIYSRDRGSREATLAFDVGQGTQDLGFRNQLPILFDCRPAVEVVLHVLDQDGKPTTGSFIFRDAQGRVYPARSRRLAPDFFFHDQIYRHDGESVRLPAGSYEVTFGRGPEYLVQTASLQVPQGKAEQGEPFERIYQLRRWIHMAHRGWFSGDHHVHAAGCAHYESPTEGVTPDAMKRHILGEDLNVGCVLSWGPCWYYQKQFFDGRPHRLSGDNYLMRYDVEVSGFPSSHCGHLCLLRLTEDDYPGTTRIEQWPSWDLPVLQWGKQQGGIVGFSHSGWGLEVPGDELPNYHMPRFDGIGANEYVVDVVHDACDFISAVDTPAVWELNVWYHTLNCGFPCRISGETDFPCIYGERVGLGRVYVKQPVDQPLDYDRWIAGVRDGRSYCGDGLSHLFDFQVNGLEVGTAGPDGRISVLPIEAGQPLMVQVQTAAWLEVQPREEIRQTPLDQKPYWHVERARVGDSRQVPVELIVNGVAVERQEIVADGQVRPLTFRYRPERSSWIALRIFPSCHTNPVFVEVDGKPIRASRRSAQWCLDAVDVCWRAKSPNIRPSERPDAAAAYEKARQVYREIVAQSHDDRPADGR